MFCFLEICCAIRVSLTMSAHSLSVILNLVAGTITDTKWCKYRRMKITYIRENDQNLTTGCFKIKGESIYSTVLQQVKS